MRMMMEMNPQLRQLMDSNPQLREVFNNPQLLRESMQMMRNPQAMQHMMRSQDLALSQLENMPGGFAALSSMYRNVQEPMMEAMAESRNSGTAERRTSSGDGASGAAMPNPWGSPTQPTRQPNQSATPRSTSTPSSNTPSNTQQPPPPLAPFMMMNPNNNPSNNNPWGSTAANNPWAAPPQDQMEQTLQMLENPMMRQTMDQMLQNPEFLQSMMAQNPMLQELSQNNPQAAALLQNPNYLRTMMQPENLRAMMQLQNSLQGLQQVPGGTPPGIPGAPPPVDFSSLLQQLQNTSIAAPHQHPADRFRLQLTSLRDMGFDDEQANLRALQANHGNLNRAVDMLLMGTVPEEVPGISYAPAAPESAAATEPSSSDEPAQESSAEESSSSNEPNKDAAEKKND
jgi:ubiquilin